MADGCLILTLGFGDESHMNDLWTRLPIHHWISGLEIYIPKSKSYRRIGGKKYLQLLVHSGLTQLDF